VHWLRGPDRKAKMVRKIVFELASGQRSSIVSIKTRAISSVAVSVAKRLATRGSDRNFAKSAVSILGRGAEQIAIVRLGAD
jgi:hypothetical protein